MTDLLSKRLIAAKRELTALKTAHRRGLGLLKVYRYDYDIPPPTGELSFYRLTVNITFETSPYPFVQRYIIAQDITSNLFFANEEIVYTNSGWGAELKAVYLIASHYPLVINSTSPITSMSYEWSNL